MMAERGLSMAHTTIMRWVQRYAPEVRENAGGGLPGRSAGHGGVDETYVKDPRRVGAAWHCQLNLSRSKKRSENRTPDYPGRDRILPFARPPSARKSPQR